MRNETAFHIGRVHDDEELEFFATVEECKQHAAEEDSIEVRWEFEDELWIGFCRECGEAVWIITPND